MSTNTKRASLVSEAYKNNQLLTTIGKILADVLEDNKKMKTAAETLEQHRRLSFHSNVAASLSITAYIQRIAKYTHCEESTLISALILIDRMCEMNNFYLMEQNIHRIVLSSIVLAIKYNEDDYYTNAYYSKVGGIVVKEMNLLEFDLLKYLEYSLFIKSETFEKYKNYLYHYIKMMI